MTIRKLFGVFSAVLTLVVLGCSSQPASPPATPIQTKAPQATQAPAGWQEEWDKTVAAARKEGVVSLYSTQIPAVRMASAQALKEKFGIDLEVQAFGNGDQAVVKIEAERRAGLYLSDVYGFGQSTHISVIKPAGLLEPIEPHLILPEVKDPKYWADGKFPFFDQDKKIIGYLVNVNRNIVYNTDMVKKGEITGFKDLLKPQYKGKITLFDPSVPGAGPIFMTHLALDVWNLDEAKDFLRRLIKEQGAVLERDKRLQVEQVVRGKYAVALAVNPAEVINFLQLGAPIECPPEPSITINAGSAGTIALANKMPHPNATKVFINWLLSKEGQATYVKVTGLPSLRTDVSREGINQLFIPQPGEKVIVDNEERFLYADKMLDITKQVIAEATK